MKKLFLLLVFSLVSLSGFSQQKNEEKIVFMNSHLVPDILEEFVDGCRYYHVDYQDKIQSLKAIKLIESTPNYLGEVKNDVIFLNADLEKYPNLLRFILFNQLGQYFGLEAGDYNFSNMMSNRVRINPKHEYFLSIMRTRPYQREKYFLALHEAHPLEIQI